MLFIGQTRFSLFNPKSSSWRATNGRFSTPEEYEAYLYSDERLTVRCRIFLEQSLPQLEAAAKGYDLLHVVSYSGNMPRKFQRLLEEAAARYPFLVLDCHSDERRPTDLDALAREHVGAGGVYGTYRLDDDDLLTVDYFDQVAPYLRPENAGMQVSLASGFTALYRDGQYSNFRETYWPMLAIGLLSVCRVEADGSVVKPAHAPHHLSDRTNPVILDSRKPSYLWVRHLDQDTAMDFGADEALSKVMSSMARYPAAPYDTDIAAVFPSIKDDLRVLVRKPILSEETTLSGEMLFEFSEPTRDFALKVDAAFGDDAVPGNALVSLDLVTLDGYPLDPRSVLAAATAAAGVAISANPAVGFYRYLDTVPGRQSNSYEFSLPAGIQCRGIKIRHWKKQDTAIRLHSVDVYVS